MQRSSSNDYPQPFHLIASNLLHNRGASMAGAEAHPYHDFDRCKTAAGLCSPPLVCAFKQQQQQQQPPRDIYIHAQ